MAERVNYISRYMPNEYGSSLGTNIPTRTPSDQWMKNKDMANSLDSSISSLDQQAAIAKASIGDPRIESTGTEKAASVGADAMVKGSDALGNAAAWEGGYGKKGKSISAKGAGAMAAGTAVAGVAGGALSNNKNEIAGGVLSGAASGASMGMAAGPWGAAVGAVVGGVAGGIKGKMDQDRRTEEEDALTKRNASMKRLQARALTQSDDLKAYQGILRGAKGTTIKYSTGGILKYDYIDVEESLRYVESLLVEAHKKGGKLKDSNILDLSSVSKDITSELLVKKENTDIPSFRRGGVMDLHKENVIIDGPSHDDTNNTGVKGDKGLPVVREGKKIAEIESLELVLNSRASSKLDTLIAKFKETKDPKIKEEMGELLSYELGHNTYDYSNLLK